jgi:hypothetical protein
MIITGGMIFTGGFNITGVSVFYYIPEIYSSSTVLLLQADKSYFNDDVSIFNNITTATAVTATSFVPSSFTTISGQDGSAYFGGAGYLSGPVNAAAFNFGTGNWTIEAWVYINAFSTNYPLIIGSGVATFSSGAISLTSHNATSAPNAFTFSAYDVSASVPVFYSTVTNVINTWYHVAVTRSVNTLTMYRNGIATTTTNISSGVAFNFSNNGLRIGGSNWDGAQSYFNGFISNVRMIQGRALYTGNFTTPTQALTLSPSPLDSGNYSFDLAASSYVQTVSNANIVYGAADFTVECWFRLTDATSGFRGIWAQNNTVLRFGDASFGNKLQFSIDQSTVASIWSCAVTGSSVVNTWNHVAWTRSSGANRLYLNGVLQSIGSGSNPVSYPATSFTDAGSITTSSGVIGNLFVGQISNVRVVNGYVVYSGNFTPPTSRLTTTQSTGTSNILPINSSVQTYSVSFNGSSHYLSVAANTAFAFGTGDFTVEAWVYLTSGSTYQFLMGSSATGGMMIGFNVPISGTPTIAVGTHNVSWFLNFGASISIPTATWTHVALTRSGSTNRAFINGVQLGSNITDSTSWAFTGNSPYIGCNALGSFFGGNISNLRIVAGLAVYTGAFTLPTSRLTVTQSSGTNIAAITSSMPNYSVSLNGSSQYLSASNIAAQFGSSNWTVEGWVYLNSIGSVYHLLACYGYQTTTTRSWVIYIDLSGTLHLAQSTNASDNFDAGFGTPAFAASTWYHVAVVRNGATITAYRNGVALSSTQTPQTLFASSAAFTIGTDLTNYLAGYISNFRIVKGSAIYTANFAVPTTALPVVAGTSLLTLQSATFVDNSVNAYTITPTGSPTTSIVSPFGAATVLLALQDSVIRDNSGLALAITNPNSASTSTQNPFGSTALLTAQDSVIRDNSIYSATLSQVGGPNTSPLTPFGVATLLTLQSNAGVDNNTVENFARIQTTSTLISKVGTVTPGTFGPFNPSGWSNFFNTGDKLTFPSSSAFDLSGSTWTVEFWMYSLTTVTSGNNLRLLMAGANGDAAGWTIGYGNDGGIGFGRPYSGSPTAIYTPAGTIALNTWYHVAIVCNAGSARIYINGVAVAGPVTISLPTSAAQTLRIGYDDVGTVNFQYNGYLSNLRIVKDRAIYTGNFTPPNSRLSTSQSAGTNITSIKTTIDYSVSLNGSSQYLTAPVASANFSTNNFTIELWAYFLSNTGGYKPVLGSNGSGDGQGWIIITETGNQLTFYSSNGSAWSYNIVSSYIPTPNAWTHIAVCRVSTTITLYANGVSIGTATIGANTNGVNGTVLNIGYYPYFPGGARFFSGYMSNVRLVNGTALYTANFTPPIDSLPVVAGTSLLALKSATFIDNSANAYTITPVNSPAISTVNPFGGTTVLLTCQSNRFVDNSINALAPTVTGAPVIALFSPLPPTDSYNASVHGSSLYFNGSSSYLNFTQEPNLYQFAGDFTVEAWVYSLSATGQASYSGIFDTRATNVSSTTGIVVNLTPSGYLNFYINGTNYTSATLLGANNWTHVALVRSGSTISMYQNGVSVASVSYATSLSSGNFWVGTLAAAGATGFWQGYISDLRAVNGAAVYTSAFTPPTQPLSATAQTVVLLNGNSAGIIDGTGKNTITTVGGAKISQAVFKYGTGSIAMTATGDYCIVSPPSVVSDISVGDFTIEFWVYFTSLAADRALISKYGNSAETAGGQGYAVQWVQASSVLRLVLGVGGGSDALYTWAWSPSISTWYHVAVTRSGTSGRAFIDGTQIGSTLTLSTANFPSPNPVQIGKTHTVAQYLLGYMDELRISRMARYTANFTPPTALLSTGTYIQIA